MSIRVEEEASAIACGVTWLAAAYSQTRHGNAAARPTVSLRC